MEVEEVKGTDASGFEQDIVKYSEFCEHVLAHQDELAEWEDADVGLQAALCATVDTLLGLYFLEDPVWETLKSKLYISFVKSTKSTNASVTSGLAASILSPGQSLGILNCRTGALKYQFYKKDYLGIVRVVEEYVAPNQHTFTSLLSDDQDVEDTLIQDIRQQLEQKHMERAEKSRTNLKLRFIAVVSGPVRDAWATADRAAQSIWELRVRSILEPLGVEPWNQQRDSYFLTKEEEANLENLATVNLIKDVNPVYDVLLSLTIGRTTCQWATSNRSFTYAYGMDNPEFLIGDPEHSLKGTVCRQVSENIAALRDLCDDWDKPVIALKSGCVISISKDKALKKIVVPRRSREVDIAQVSFTKGQVLRALIGSSPSWVTVQKFDPETQLYTWLAPQENALSAPLPFVFSIRSPEEVIHANTCPEQIHDIKIETKMQQKSQFERPRLLKTLRAEAWKGKISDKYGILYDNLCLIVEPPEVFLSAETGKAEIFDLRSRSIAGTAYWKIEEVNKTSGCTPSKSIRLVFNQEFQERLLTCNDRVGGNFLLRFRRGKVAQEVAVVIEPCFFPLFTEQKRISLIRGGCRVMATLDGIDEHGEFTWRVDNSHDTFAWPIDDGKNDPREAQSCAVFRYQKNTTLLLWVNGVGWTDASVVEHIAGNQHSILVLMDGGLSKGTFDLNEFNHTWPNLEPQLGKAHDAFQRALQSYIKHEEERFRYVEDAITCKKLEVKDQLLLIHTDQTQQANSNFPAIANVSALVNLMVKSIEDNTLRGSGALNPVPVLIKAAAGSGKTWTMWQMMYLLSVRKVAPLAIFVQRLANLLRTIPDALAQCQISFVEFYIRHTLEKESRIKFLLQAFRMRTLVIAVDGIDEAADYKTHIIEFIFTQLVAQGHCFVVTSRPEAIDAETQQQFQKSFIYMDLKPLDLAQQDFAVQQQLKDNVCFHHLRDFSNARIQHDICYDSMDERARKAVESGLPKPKNISDSDKRYWQKNCSGLDLRAHNNAPVSVFLTQNMSTYLNSKELAELATKTGEGDKTKLLSDICAKCDEMYVVAERARPHIEVGLKQLYRQQGLSVDGAMVFAPLKSPIRAMEKALDDYGGNVARVLDIVRCRIICTDLALISRLVVALAKPPFWLQLVRVKNKFDPKELVASHFRTILLNLKAMCCQCGTLQRSFLDDVDSNQKQCCAEPTRTWHMFEIQIHHKTILEMDEKLHTHEHYEYLRSLTNVKVSDQLNFLLEKQISLFAAIAQTPVLLSLLIVVLDRADHKLPTSVYELYEFAIEASLQNWCNQRMQVEEEGWMATIRNVVRLVAFKNHRKKRKEFTGKGINPQLWREICGTGENDCVVLSFIKVISQNYLYQFSHLSFQEFLYLEELQDRARKQLPVPHFSELLADPWFNNALLLSSDDMKIALLQATSLDFDGQLKDSQAAILAIFLKTNTTVTSLDIRHNSIKDSAIALALCQAVLGHPCLEIFSGINLVALRQTTSRSAAASTADLSEMKEADPNLMLPVGRMDRPSLSTLSFTSTFMIRDTALTVGGRGFTLNLQNNGIGLVESLVLASLLRVNDKVTSLDMADNQLELEAMTALAQALRVNSGVRSLDVSSNKLGDAGAAAIASTLEVNQTLTSLNLYSNEIEAKGATIICEALRTNRTLTSLNLDHNNVFAAAGAISEALKVNLGLQKLDLSSNGIGDKGAALIARGLKVNSKLMYLDLSNNPIDDKGMSELATAIKANTVLQVLKLSNIDIKDEGAVDISSMIKANTSLITIVLTSNAITDKGATSILKNLKVNKAIETCQLYDNKISAEVMSEVKATLAENKAFREFQESQGKTIKRKKWPFR